MNLALPTHAPHGLRFTDAATDLGAAVAGSYDPVLVVVSFVIAIVAAYATLLTTTRVAAAVHGVARIIWLSAGAFTMGSGIWAMHFIGMLAFTLPFTVTYGWGTTLLSLVPAIVASAVVIHMMSTPRMGTFRLHIAALIMASGIGAMHYTGMAAMMMNADMLYDPALFATSIVVAFALAALALTVKQRLGERRLSGIAQLVSAVVMGCAVACMHYTAMAATVYIPGVGAAVPASALSNPSLAIGTALLSAILLGAVMITTVVDQRFGDIRDRLHLILNSAGEGICGLDTEGRATFANPAAARMMGWDAAALIGRPIHDVLRVTRADGTAYAPDDCPTSTSLHDGKTQHSNAETFTRQDGTPVPVEYISTPMHARDGHIVGAVLTFRDRTEQRALEQDVAQKQHTGQIIQHLLSLALNDTPLATLLDHALHAILSAPFAAIEKKGGIFLADAKDQTLHLAAHTNLADPIRSQCKTIRFGQCLCGRAAESNQLIHASCVDERHEIGFDGMAEHGHYNVPITFRGEVRGVIVLYLPHGHERSDDEVQFLTAVADTLAGIIERKTTEARLRRMAKAVESAAESILILDAAGVIEYANPAFLNYSAFASEEVLGRRPRDIALQNPDPESTAAMRAALLSDGTWSGILHIERRDGRVHDEEHTVSSVRDPESGRITNYVALIRDVTERIQMEQQLRQAQKLESMGRLAAGIAHEINTPTQYVSDNTVFLQRAFTGLMDAVAAGNELLTAARASNTDHGAIEHAEVAFKKAKLDFLQKQVPPAFEQSLEGLEQVSRIVSAMKEFSHPAQDKTDLDLNRAIQSTITVARSEWKYVAEMHTEFDESLPLVPCLPGEFNQVILNIIVNAAHAISDVVGDGADGRGQIMVTTRHADDCAEIRIGDSGAGMSADVRAHIFDAFFTTKEVGKGTGQGLAIAYNVIVEKHGGTIDVESAPGEGTTFIIRLPLQAPTEAEHTKEAA